MKKSSLAILAVLLLGGCASGDAKEALGLKIDAPDEFAVERKPKLDVPPAFNLRPPTPGSAPLNGSDTRDMAREELTGTSKPIVADKGEASFLSKAGATSANPNIRGVLTQEYPQTEKLDMLEKIQSISDKNVGSILVDADKEKKRIEENKKNDKPLTTGETPTKSINDGKSVIDKVFN